MEDLLQIARIAQKSTSIEVVGETIGGVIYFRDGAVVDAVIEGRPLPAGNRFSQIVEAIEILAAVEIGTFEFGDLRSPNGEDRPIDVSAIAVAMEKDTLREKRLVDLGLGAVESLAIDRHVSSPVTLDPAVWQLIVDLIEPFSLGSLESKMGRRKAVATMLTLDALGVLGRNDVPPHLSPGADPSAAVDEASRELSTHVSSEADQPSADDGEPDAEVFDMDWEVDGGTADDLQSVAPSDDASRPIDVPVVEVFAQTSREERGPLREVVAPVETTLVTGVLGDMRTRFRGRTPRPDFDAQAGTSSSD
jgi:hypothetical protein